MTAAHASPQLEALWVELADGEWHNGLTILREIQKAITPGVAEREGRLQFRKPDEYTLEEIKASGKRALAHSTMSAQFEIGRLERDVEKLTRAHWAGELPWRVRDSQAGWRTIVEAADELGITESVIRSWIRNGFVPHSKNPAGKLRLSKKDFEICLRVRKVWPGHGKTHWPVDPRTLWTEGGTPALVCPHCNGKLAVTITEA